MFLEGESSKAYLRWVKNIMTTTKTSNISVAKTPIVAMVPRFMFPSSPKVTHPLNIIFFMAKIKLDITYERKLY